MSPAAMGRQGVMTRQSCQEGEEAADSGLAEGGSASEDALLSEPEMSAPAGLLGNKATSCV